MSRPGARCCVLAQVLFLILTSSSSQIRWAATETKCWASFNPLVGSTSSTADVPRGPARKLQRHRQLEETVAEAADLAADKLQVVWLPDPNTKLLFCPVKNKKKKYF